MKAPRIENPKFFTLVAQQKIIHEDFIEDLLNEMDGNALDVLATMIQSGIGTKRQLCQLWCDSIGIAHVDLEKSLFQPEIVRKVPERFAREKYAIPVYQLGSTVTVATPTPNDKVLKGYLEHIIDAPVNLVFALPYDVEWAIENEYQTNTALYEFFTKIKTRRVFEEESLISERKLLAIAGKESINQLHVGLILFGITERASEIQIDPEESSVNIFFVVDGQLQQKLQIDKPVYEKLLANIKTLAKTTSEKTTEPHYSRILFPTPGKKFDIQFLTLPTEFGEKVYLKLMDRSAYKKVLSLSEQYVSLKNKTCIKDKVNKQKGVILISGLSKDDYRELSYSVIKEVQAIEIKKLTTIEESPSSLLKDAEQLHVNPKANFACADALETCLLNAPEVVYIQNIDDPKTSQKVINAAKKGIFVIAGIEAEDAFDALSKTMDSIGPVTSLIINQKKVRRLCDHCKIKRQLSHDEMLRFFHFEGNPELFVYDANGCPYCQHSGYLGHIGIQELLVIDVQMKQLISENKPIEEIIKIKNQSGIESKEYDGIKKVLRGLTTFSEINNIAKR
jgi:type IV pilus assembly protein PilB